LINKGANITPEILCNFINDEIKGSDEDQYNVKECQDVVTKINQLVSIHVNMHPHSNGHPKSTINLSTYLRYIIPICQDYVVKKVGVKELFQSLDKNSDGLITAEDLMAVIYKVNKTFTANDIVNFKKEIKKMCSKADTNKDGYLSFDEFKAFMEKNI
jgi:hypothetical protein